MGAGLTAYLKSEFSNWGKGETIWLFSASAVILGLSLYWGDSLLGIIAALTGVWCVVLTGMGKSVCFVFGIVNVLCYAYISYGAKYYGEVMLNTLYYFPMNFVGLYIWNKHTNKETGEVDKRHLNNKKGSNKNPVGYIKDSGMCRVENYTILTFKEWELSY